MSHSAILAVWPGEKNEELIELSNSWGSAPVIWNDIAKKYLGLKDHEYSFHENRLWSLYKTPDMPEHERAVLLMTYDRVMVLKEHYEKAVNDIEIYLKNFPPNPKHVNHWQTIADLFKSNPDCPAIGFHMTSVSDNLFDGEFNEETEEYDQPDWSKFWDVYGEIENIKTSIETKGDK